MREDHLYIELIEQVKTKQQIKSNKPTQTEKIFADAVVFAEQSCNKDTVEDD